MLYPTIIMEHDESRVLLQKDLARVAPKIVRADLPFPRCSCMGVRMGQFDNSVCPGRGPSKFRKFCVWQSRTVPTELVFPKNPEARQISVWHRILR